MYQFLPRGSWSIVVMKSNGRLELDVVEPGIGSGELMPLARRDQYQVARAHGRLPASSFTSPVPFSMK
jgi:hypothetical protein